VKLVNPKIGDVGLKMDTKSSTNTKPDLASVARLKPEWVRVPDAVHYCGISRSLIYELIGSGQILSKSLRKPGHIRGIRLISVASLDAFLKNLPEGGVK